MYFRSDLDGARREAHGAYLYYSGRDSEWAWKFRLLEAEVLVNQGLSKDALTLLDAQLPSSIANGDLAIRQLTLQGLASALLGQPSDAEEKLRIAESRLHPPVSSLDGEVARARGVVKLKQNDLDDAETYFRRSLKIAENQQDEFLRLTALLNLGAVALRKEHYDQAIDWSNSAHDVAHSLGAKPDEEKTLGNLGWAYYKMGDFDKSLDLFSQAATQAHDLGIVVDQVLWINNLGLVSYELGRLQDAENYYKHALSLAEQTQNKAEITDALTELALVSARNGRLDSATDFVKQAYALTRGQNNRRDGLYTVYAMGEVAERSGDLKRAREQYLEIDGDSQTDSSLRWTTEHRLAGLDEKENQRASAEREYKRALGNLEVARASLDKEESRLPFATNAAAVYDDYVNFLVTHNRIVESLQVADYSRAQTLAEGLGALGKQSGYHPSSPDLRQVARKANATILFYWLGAEKSYLWAVTSSGVSISDLPSAQTIDERIARYKKVLVSARDPLQTANEDGVALYNLLIAPAAKLIKHGSRVVIVPDGSLNSLNFETLLVEEPTLHYWIDDATVSNASSIQLIAAAKSQHTPTNTSRRLLLIGDPISPNRDYGELPGAGGEISQVASHFSAQARDVFAREKATATAYEQSNPNQFSYIHFVAHGTASRISPLDSAVILSKASAEEDSFKLYARDIVKYPLDAQLVTISACYGSGDRTFSGEGLVGLSWAFLRAGSHNVIGALWDVSDESTPALMDKLYAGLRNGQAPDIALRAAKLSLLHSDGVFRKTFYWAPFQLYTGS
jgi:CHAT domain-containing protein/Tfp pilus assembly protein PilF